MPSQLRSAFAILTVAAALTSCAGSPDPAGPVSSKIQRESLQLISPAEIESKPQDSPNRALLEWWRLAQYRDAAGAVQLFTPVARKAVNPGFATSVYNDFGPWLQHVKPRVLKAETNGAQTTLFLELSIREVLSPSVVRDRKEYVAIPMQRAHGKWMIADASFYLANAQRLRIQREQATKR
jgi:hypothetical protein